MKPWPYPFWIAHRGAGQQSSRYGRANDWLVSAKLATPRGLLTTEDFPGSSAGPRLTDLVLGSEGTFGVITEATFHIRPAPAESLYIGFLFHDFATGAAAIRQAVQEELPFAMLRLSDSEETRFYRSYGAVGKRKSIGSRVTDAYLKYRKFGDSAASEQRWPPAEPPVIATKSGSPPYSAMCSLIQASARLTSTM